MVLVGGVAVMVALVGTFVVGCVCGYLYATRTDADVIPRFQHYDEQAQARFQVYRQIAGEWPVVRPPRTPGKVGDDDTR
jgi:hypothetical protein